VTDDSHDSRPPRFLHLQALRAVAASLVVVDHAVNNAIERGVVSATWQPLTYQVGGFGVLIFFVTSGVIMYITAGGDFGSAQGAASFARRRVIRVLPLYWIATLVIAALHVRSTSPLALVKSLLFIPYAEPGAVEMRPVLGVGWTLNYEMFFYLVFAIGLLFPKRIGLTFIGTVLVGLPVAGVLLDLHSPGQPSTVLGFYTGTIILYFGIGIVLGWLALRFDLGRRSLPVNPIAVAGVVVVAGLAVWQTAGMGAWNDLASDAVKAVFITASVLVCLTKAAETGVASRVFQHAGDASYSTYLFHLLVVAVVAAAWRFVGPSPATVVPFVLGAVLAANLAAMVIYRYLEKPMLRLLRRGVPGRRAVRATA
jgi:exopolysaccharide production protein ExoZ